MFTTLTIALASLSVSLTNYQASIAPQAVVQTTQMTVGEQLVRLTFWDSPEMVEILRCESYFRQFNAKGQTLKNWNKNGTVDKGIGQINSVHEKEAQRLGFNLDTLEGNLGFSRYLYDRQGVEPWVCADKIGNAPVETLASRAFP